MSTPPTDYYPLDIVLARVRPTKPGKVEQRLITTHCDVCIAWSPQPLDLSILVSGGHECRVFHAQQGVYYQLKRRTDLSSETRFFDQPQESFFARFKIFEAGHPTHVSFSVGFGVGMFKTKDVDIWVVMSEEKPQSSSHFSHRVKCFDKFYLFTSTKYAQEIMFKREDSISQMIKFNLLLN